MNRLAIFVEGYTEALFIKNLIEEIAGPNKVKIDYHTIRGGSKAPRTIEIVASQPHAGQEYYVLIMDCGGDKLVKTRILEEHRNFTQKGYSRIIGIRDVRPDFTYSDIPRLEANLPLYVKTSLIPVSFILSVMEIEAWFLAEFSHFSKISPAITAEDIQSNFGFDPRKDDMQLRLNPSEDLNNCYQIGGMVYEKNNVSLTVDNLDYVYIYLEFCNKFAYFKRLLDELNTFFN